MKLRGMMVKSKSSPWRFVALIFFGMILSHGLGNLSWAKSVNDAQAEAYQAYNDFYRAIRDQPHSGGASVPSLYEKWVEPASSQLGRAIFNELRETERRYTRKGRGANLNVGLGGSSTQSSSPDGSLNAANPSKTNRAPAAASLNDIHPAGGYNYTAKNFPAQSPSRPVQVELDNQDVPAEIEFPGPKKKALAPSR